MWPNLQPPPEYENPDLSWTDPDLPDIQLIWKYAREKGYAVGIHGSLKGDFDLIAAPWIEDASTPQELIDHLCKGINANQVGGLEFKPLGRVAVNLQVDGWFKLIDLSIMPKVIDNKE